MIFRTRAIGPADVDECFELLCQRPLWGAHYADSRRAARARETWQQLLKSHAVVTRLVEAPELPAGQRIVTFGLSAFVRPDWLAAFGQSPFPLFGAWVVDEAGRADGARVLLTQHELAVANSHEGVHGITLALGWAPHRIPPEAGMEYQQCSFASFREAHEGYRLAELASECFEGPEAELFLSTGGWRLRSDYSAHYAEQGLPRPTPAPLLVGLTRAEAQEPSRAAAITAGYFVWRQPRFFFTPEQQAFLLLASDHKSDRELGASLDIGDAAVGRRWTRIFRRVEGWQSPDDPVFPPGCDSAGKRARLLRYLAAHAYELRPHSLRGTRREVGED